MYFDDIATGVIYNDERQVRHWKLGSAIQPHHSTRDTRNPA